uniref:Uncharacterized protein n=1 Tax=candidate division WWE3 bacterium TaxID=2053526 RepID=A0A7C4XGT3_UNCKA
MICSIYQANYAKNTLANYISSISSKYVREQTSEMGYRTDFELFLKDIFQSINVSKFDHDPKAKQGNKPDFVVIKGGIPILYIETKDIGVSDIGYFVYCNGQTDREAFDGKLEFDVTLISYEGNDSWVEKVITDVHKCLQSGKYPKSNAECDYCAYVESISKLGISN